jgi:hypothetical protein
MHIILSQCAARSPGNHEDNELSNVARSRRKDSKLSLRLIDWIHVCSVLPLLLDTFISSEWSSSSLNNGTSQIYIPQSTILQCSLAFVQGLFTFPFLRTRSTSTLFQAFSLVVYGAYQHWILIGKGQEIPQCCLICWTIRAIYDVKSNT